MLFHSLKKGEKMFILWLILFIATAIALAYLFIKIMLIYEDIDTLYDNYAKLLERSFKNYSRKDTEV